MNAKEILNEYELYGRIETTHAPLRLFAIGTANWDIYADDTGALYSIVKDYKPSAKGAHGTLFGDCNHIRNLQREGYWNNILTAYGEELMNA